MFNKLNEMVSKSVYNREQYIRMVLLEKKQIRETPKTYLTFSADLRRLASSLSLFKWNKGLTEGERNRLMELSSDIYQLVRKLNNEYFFKVAKPGQN